MSKSHAEGGWPLAKLWRRWGPRRLRALVVDLVIYTAIAALFAWLLEIRVA